MKRAIWDYQDYYYYSLINNFEINIRAYDENCISLWIYINSKDIEIKDNEYQNLEQVKEVINKSLLININLPTIEQLLKIKE